jgi:hypothetical protein
MPSDVPAESVAVRRWHGIIELAGGGLDTRPATPRPESVGFAAIRAARWKRAAGG